MCKFRKIMLGTVTGVVLSASAVLDTQAQSDGATIENAAEQGQALDTPNLPMSEQTISVDDGRLSVSLTNAPFREAMASVSRQSGIEIRVVAKQDPEPLTDSFTDLTLEEGLRRLLTDSRGQLFQYSGQGEERRLSQVFVLTDEGQQPDLELPVASTASAAPAAGLGIAAQQLGGVPIELLEKINALGTNEKKQQEILRALNDAQQLMGTQGDGAAQLWPNPGTQEEIQREILRQLQAQYPELEQQLSGAWQVQE